MSTPVDFDYDPDEYVTLPREGTKTLRTFVHEIMSKPLTSRRPIALYRERGRKPAILNILHIERLAKAPEFNTGTG
jgi:hypothetical protein